MTYSENPIHNAFGVFFFLARIWENITDHTLADDGLTMRQLLLFIVLQSQFDKAPGVKELSGRMGTSHQNTKSICRNLEKKGFLTLTRDEHDRRIWRVRVTPEAERIFIERAGKDMETMNDLFSPLSQDEIREFNRMLIKLTEHAVARHAGETNQAVTL